MSKELDCIAELERENRLLGERCNQLLKDKGDLTDKIADIKANCDLAIEGRDIKIKELEEENNKLLDVINNQNVKIADLEKQIGQIQDAKCTSCTELGGMQLKINRLEQQIEKMKRHCNCKHRDSEGYCEVKRTYLMDLSYDGCDKWEIEK